ncbi:MAG TPA: hypothetical protein VG962_07270 [Steroidobacteraceae bacterium]|nr:hypothetical protein [Steroidobacteraceae bacterium]
MISAASNCCRVDAVKASANTLRQQLAQHARGTNDNALQTAEQQLQSVDQQVRANNANQAEVALSAAKLSVEKLGYTQTGLSGTDISATGRYGNQYGRLNIYA